MKLDLEALSREELKDLKKRVDKALSDYDEREKQRAKAEAEKLAASFGYTLSELVNGKKGKGKVNPPKYAHPENPALTYTGRGRRPQWLQEELDKGKSLDDFRIAK